MSEIDPMLERHQPDLKTEGEGGDDNAMQQTYPSPLADSQGGAPFYTSESRPDQQPQHDFGQAHEGQEQLDDQLDAHQQMHPNITSAEELQLAAQLSQGLAHHIPMMDPADPALQHVVQQQDMDGNMDHNMQMHEQDFQVQVQGQHQDGQMPHQQDQMQQQQQQQHQHQQHQTQPEHSHDMTPDHIHEHDQQQMAGVHNDQQLQQDEQQPPQQLQGEPPSQPQSQLQPPSMVQFDPGQQQQPPPLQPAAPMEQHLGPHIGPNISGRFNLDNHTPPRKRSKVSRACDECRRKKVKCDAASETGEEPCSNCRRSNIRCLFSRIPQKRGPSKGYIKELADRINSIEGRLQSEGVNANIEGLSEMFAPRRESSELFASPGQPDDNGRKRPFSSISGGEFAQSFQNRPINGFTPTPIAPKSDGNVAAQPVAVMESMQLDFNHVLPDSRDLDEGVFSIYLDWIHPCLPVLASNRTRVDAQLTQCPMWLRDGFVEALGATVQMFSPYTGFYANGDVPSALRNLLEYEVNDKTERSHVMRLVHLQTLILIAIATENSGPAALKDGSLSNILSRASGAASAMKLHYAQLDSDIERDLDSDECIATRAWWVLIMLDRWHAIGSGSYFFIPYDTVVIPHGLQSLVGDTAYQAVRLSVHLGYLASAAFEYSKSITSARGVPPMFSNMLNMTLEQFRDHLPDTVGPLVHMTYWHCRTLTYLFQANARATDVLWSCRESAKVLLANVQFLSPFNHHFFCLTALTLLELAKVDAHKEEATSQLRQLLDADVAHSAWSAIIRDRIMEQVRPTTAQATAEAAANQGLQHLADLATATTGGDLEAVKTEKGGLPEDTALRLSDNYQDLGFDPRPWIYGGYLRELVEPVPRPASAAAVAR